MIYHIDYVSEGLHVKGYLGLPPQLPHALSHSMADTAGTRPGVSVKGTLACSWRPYKEFQHPDGSTRKLPLLIYCRGGIGRVGAVRLKWVEEFAMHGFAVFAPAYRGNEGSEGRDEFGGADTMDVVNAIDWLRDIPWIDPARIYLLGFSRGAINAAKAAVISPVVAKLILWSGVSDLAQTYEERIDLRRMMKRVIGGSPNKVPERYLARSPLHYAEQLKIPVLIVHGTRDEQVLIGHSYRMADRLAELGRQVETHFYRDLKHHFPPPQHEAAVHRMCCWLMKD
ncbi:peptidase S9 [Paenibacillus ihbetae]|uniref:Peptidase S9 n=1 Tax=Paenibacillus ihbetae TaxID=1870820 RepID=A0A1B2E6S1_9BACL|nr:prolyl oligopeptidase family serine peptidase [Paenibacillus ihbetae]ANY75668.1 peptidase S9 [Paenibacillus ihbetae]